MGGSGGRYFPAYKPEDYQKKVESAEAQTRDAQYEAEANDLLASYLADFNNRDVDGTNEILEKVTEHLSDVFEGTVNLLFGGSVAKRTYVDGLSDVDALLLVHETAIAEDSPDAVKQACASQLRKIFPKAKISVGQMAVTIEADGKIIQLLPALRAGEHFKVTNPEGRGWSTIRPRLFAQALTKVNSELGNKLVPTIKLAKALIGQMPEQRRLSGYHVEALAVKIFDGYKGELAPRSMLKHFFENVGPRLLNPIADVTGQSDKVDEYLGEPSSIQRRVIADACARIGRRLKGADGAKDLALWRQLFGDEPR